jgi:hypothetical protein
MAQPTTPARAARGSTARTDLPPGALGPSGDASVAGSPDSHPASAAQGPSQGAAGPQQVRLRDGRLVTLRRTSGLDDSHLEQAMLELGFTRLDGPGQATYLRCAAVNAIEKFDNVEMGPVRSGAELSGRLALLFGDDIGAIVAAYLVMNGLPPAAGRDDFRPGDRG